MDIRKLCYELYKIDWNMRTLLDNDKLINIYHEDIKEE